MNYTWGTVPSIASSRASLGTFVGHCGTVADVSQRKHKVSQAYEMLNPVWKATNK